MFWGIRGRTFCTNNLSCGAMLIWLFNLTTHSQHVGNMQVLQKVQRTDLWHGATTITLGSTCAQLIFKLQDVYRDHKQNLKETDTSTGDGWWNAWSMTPRAAKMHTKAHIHNPSKPQSESRLSIKPNSVIILQSLNIYGPTPTIPQLSFIICQQKFRLWMSTTWIHLENYRGTAHHWLLPFLYCYSQSKESKQKSSESVELQANQCLVAGRQTQIHCDCWGEKMYTFGWNLLLCFEYRQTVKLVCSAKLVSTMTPRKKEKVWESDVVERIFCLFEQRAFIPPLFWVTTNKCLVCQSRGGTLSKMMARRYSTKNSFVLFPFFCFFLLIIWAAVPLIAF